MGGDADAKTYPRDVPIHEGMPEGWKGIEKQYLSGKYAGQTYVRWYSLDGRHKHLCTPASVIEIDAKEKGHDAETIEAMVKAYKDAQEAKRERQLQERQKEREERGLLKGQLREEVIAEFRAKFGSLMGPIVHAMPGWRTRWDYMTNCSQVHVTYTDPDNKEWKILKDIECSLGYRMRNGEDITTLMANASASANPNEFTECSATCRDTKETVESDGPSRNQEIGGKWAKRMAAAIQHAQHSQREAVPEDFQESSLVVAAAAAGVAAGRQLSSAGCPDAESLAANASGVRVLLNARGFPASTELLAVFGHRAKTVGMAEECLAGIYHELPATYNDRACYQKVERSGKRARALECQELYIFWSAKRARWKIGSSLDDALAGYAFCAQDASRPWEARATAWQTVRSSDGSK
eukprot:TRINITY_DN10932_c0_g1_i1.p1 TRINITY_DN10932_c0_g1~~TRINITY_DN10932_c0_g1_i1.p1  ORF type:complete len:441 (+),score=90.44 TRINITY_DN10932_c0_g1_i1:99-1325(+)